MAESQIDKRRIAARRRLQERYGASGGDRALGSAVVKTLRGRAVERDGVSDAEAKRIAEVEQREARTEARGRGTARNRRR